jgi:hypothetical protein
VRRKLADHAKAAPGSLFSEGTFEQALCLTENLRKADCGQEIPHVSLENAQGQVGALFAEGWATAAAQCCSEYMSSRLGRPVWNYHGGRLC